MPGVRFDPESIRVRHRLVMRKRILWCVVVDPGCRVIDNSPDDTDICQTGDPR